jgi:hypothetical protein
VLARRIYIRCCKTMLTTRIWLELSIKVFRIRAPWSTKSILCLKVLRFRAISINCKAPTAHRLSSSLLAKLRIAPPSTAKPVRINLCSFLETQAVRAEQSVKGCSPSADVVCRRPPRFFGHHARRVCQRPVRVAGASICAPAMMYVSSNRIGYILFGSDRHLTLDKALDRSMG